MYIVYHFDDCGVEIGTDVIESAWNEDDAIEIYKGRNAGLIFDGDRFKAYWLGRN